MKLVNTSDLEELVKEIQYGTQMSDNNETILNNQARIYANVINDLCQAKIRDSQTKTDELRELFSYFLDDFIEMGVSGKTFRISAAQTRKLKEARKVIQSTIKELDK